MNEFQSYKGLSVHETTSELNSHLEELNRNGYFVIQSIFDNELLTSIRLKMDVIWNSQLDKFGEKLLRKIGDWGQIRAMMKDEDIFSNLIINPEILKYVDAVLGDTAILHLQNGIVLHPNEKHNQSKYHKDFPKEFLSSKILSFNAFIAIDEFTSDNGGTWVIPGSHKFAEMPSQNYINQNQKQIICPPGSVIFFDSTLWHKGGNNNSNKLRRAINQCYKAFYQTATRLC